MFGSISNLLGPALSGSAATLAASLVAASQKTETADATDPWFGVQGGPGDYHFNTPSVLKDPIQSEITKVETSIASGKAADSDKLLDKRDQLKSLLADRNDLLQLKLQDLGLMQMAGQTISELERLARTPDPSEKEIKAIHQHAVLLKNYAVLDQQTSWLKEHANLKTSFVPTGDDTFSWIGRQFLTSGPVGAVYRRFQESGNPADREVAKVIDQALRKQSLWNDKELSWKGLAAEVDDLKSIYGSPEWRIFHETLARASSSEHDLAIIDLTGLPDTLAEFEANKDNVSAIGKTGLASVRAYLLDRLHVRYLEKKAPIEMEKDLEDLEEKLGLPKTEDSALSEGNIKLGKEAEKISKLEDELTSVDLDDKEAAFKTLQKVATFLDQGKGDHLKSTLLGLAARANSIPSQEQVSELSDVRKEIDAIFANPSLTSAEMGEKAQAVIKHISRISYIRLADCRIHELEKKFGPISSMNTWTNAATKAALSDDYGGVNDDALAEMDEAQAKEEADIKGLINGYRNVLDALKSGGDSEKTIENFSELEKSKLHEQIDDHFEDAELFDTFSKGLLITIAACATGGYAAALLPEAFASTTLGSFVALGIETTAFTVSVPIYRALVNFENPITPIKEMIEKPGELGEHILVNMLVFGALRGGTKLFAQSFKSLVAREGVQTVLKEMSDFVAKIEKNPALQEELSKSIQKTLVDAGFQGGALVTQTGILQVSDFIQTANRLIKSGDDDPIGHALEKTFSGQTLLKEFAFNLALHLAPSPSHSPKEKTDKAKAEDSSFAAGIESTLTACGAKETDKGRITYDPAKQKVLFDRIEALRGVSDAKGQKIEFKFMGPVVELTMPTLTGPKTYTFQPQAA